MTNNKAQQSAEKTAEQQQVLRDLLALGKKNGRLTLKEMADALSHLELESDDIDKLYETLESMGVEVETEGVLEKALGDGDDDSFDQAAQALPLTSQQINWAHLQALAWADAITQA